MSPDERIERTGLLYERFVFGCDDGALAAEAAGIAEATDAQAIARQVEEARARL